MDWRFGHRLAVRARVFDKICCRGDRRHETMLRRKTIPEYRIVAASANRVYSLIRLTSNRSADTLMRGELRDRIRCACERAQPTRVAPGTGSGYSSTNVKQLSLTLARAAGLGARLYVFGRRIDRRRLLAHSLNRRQLLRVGVLGSFGLTLSGLLRAEAFGQGMIVRGSSKPIRSCILVFHYGGPSHLDTFDMKPGCAVEWSLDHSSRSPPPRRVCGFLRTFPRQLGSWIAWPWCGACITR